MAGRIEGDVARARSRPACVALVAVLLAGCGGGGEVMLPVDATWCGAEASLVDPLPDLFDGVADLDTVAQDYVARDRYSSGAVIATVSGEGVRFHAAGSTRWGGEVAVDQDTAFELGSITKVLTSLLFADAVARGELALDDDCNTYLPAEGRLPSRDGVPVKLWHLATHTAGLPRDAPGFTPGPYDPWYATYTIDDFHAALRGVRLASTPGTRSSYSNMGAVLLGHILTLRTGLTYEELLRTRVLTPLGMTSTYLYEEPEGLRLATPYHHRDVETDYFMVPAGLEGAGRIRSTAADLARFARAALGLDATPLDEAFALSEAQRFKGDGGNGAVTEMGLGWGRAHEGGALFVGHGGGTWGFTTSLNLDRDRQYGTIVLTNSRHARDCLPGYLAYWITAWQKTTVLDAGTLSQYPGTYATPLGGVVVSRDGAHLSAYVPGRSPQRIEPEGNDRFFSLSQDLELRFERDAGGRVSGLALRTSAEPVFGG